MIATKRGFFTFSIFAFKRYSVCKLNIYKRYYRVEAGNMAIFLQAIKIKYKMGSNKFNNIHKF